MFLAIQVIYFVLAVSVKTSLLLLYYRIFGVIRWFRWLLVAVWCATLIYFIACVPIAVFKISPAISPAGFYVEGFSKTGNTTHFYLWNGVANLLIDFTVWSLSMPVVWHLRLNVRQKLSISAIFLLGLLSVPRRIQLLRKPNLLS